MCLQPHLGRKLQELGTGGPSARTETGRVKGIQPVRELLAHLTVAQPDGTGRGTLGPSPSWRGPPAFQPLPPACTAQFPGWCKPFPTSRSVLMRFSVHVIPWKTPMHPAGPSLNVTSSRKPPHKASLSTHARFVVPSKCCHPCLHSTRMASVRHSTNVC